MAQVLDPPTWESQNVNPAVGPTVDSLDTNLCYCLSRDRHGARDSQHPCMYLEVLESPEVLDTAPHYKGAQWSQNPGQL